MDHVDLDGSQNYNENLCLGFWFIHLCVKMKKPPTFLSSVPAVYNIAQYNCRDLAEVVLNYRAPGSLA